MRSRPTPILVPRSALLGGALVAAAGALYTALAVPAVPRILFGGVVLAMFLWYPLRWLETWLPRRVAVAVLLIGMSVLILLATLMLLPPLTEQLRSLVDDAPRIQNGARERIERALAPLEDSGLIQGSTTSMVQRLQDGLVARVQTAADGVLRSSVGLVSGALGVVVQTLGILFVGISLLVDQRRLKARAVLATPKPYRRDVLQLLNEIGRVLSRYLVALLVIALVQGVSAAIFLRVIGVPYSLLLASWIAATSTIPYLGTWFGGVPAILLAALQSPLDALLTFLAFFATTTAIGNVITPRVQGDAVGVHPVLVLLGVVAGGGLFGLLGVFLAVPTLAVLRVLLDFLRVRIRAS